MLNTSSYCDTRRYFALQKGGRKYAKQKSFKEQYFPFHRLPREIIAHIFVLCLPDFEEISNTITKNAAPILMCNVSSSWRSLALSIPRLWNELPIAIMDPRLDIDIAVSMVESWIARSGELPLSLRLHANPRTKRGKATTQAHLNTFFRYASRWESVYIWSPVESFPKFGPTPLLRKFSYTGSYIPLPFPFTSCPLLSALSWPFSCSITSNPEIPWHQLSHITMDTRTGTQEVLDILRTCEVLAELNVEIYDDLSLDQVQPLRKPVENRTLRSFHILHIMCSVLFQSLTLPALTDFSLAISYNRDSNTASVHTELLGLFTRSRCKLERLELEHCMFTDTEILNCFQHDSCSSLTELQIEDHQPMFTDRVILALTIKDDLSEVNNVLLPKLSHLLLDTCVSASPGVLGIMALSRCLWGNEDGMLKSFILLLEVLDDADYRYLEMAEKLGLDVSITVLSQNS